MENNKKEILLDGKELDFCDLFVFGGASYQWKPLECYVKSFLDIDATDVIFYKNIKKVQQSSVKANRLRKSGHITAHIYKLMTEGKSGSIEGKILKEQSVDILKSIAIECSTSEFIDENGNRHFSAAHRSASIRAIDTLTKLVPEMSAETEENGVGKASISFTITPVQTTLKDETKKNEAE